MKLSIFTFVDRAAGVAVLVLAAAHISLAGLLEAPLTQDKLWFAAAGVAMASTGALNLLRARGRGDRALALVAALFNASLFALVVAYGLVTSAWAEFVVAAQLVLYAILFASSLRAAFARANSAQPAPLSAQSYS